MLGDPADSRAGAVLGTMCLGRPDRFPEDIIQFAEDIGRRAALAMDNARLYAQQAAANRALQRSLLPPNEPGEIPGLDSAVVYEPAGETNEVGGDFYDLFAAGDDSWRFAVGDVCGTGPEAAAVTGLARHTLRLLVQGGVRRGRRARPPQPGDPGGGRAGQVPDPAARGDHAGADRPGRWAGLRRSSRGAAAAARAASWRPW